MCILDNIDSIKSYGRENLYLKPEWDAPKGSGEKKKNQYLMKWKEMPRV